jgi:hypothetical protein
MTPTLSEKQIENVFEIYHEQLLEEGMEFLSRPKNEINDLRVNLLFKDKNGKKVAVVVRKETIPTEDVGLARKYARSIKCDRLIIAAPHVKERIQKSFVDSGIECLEFDISEVLSLSAQIADESTSGQARIALNFKKNYAGTEKDSSFKSNPDGNLAFKVVYTDSNWNGVCSREVAQQNFIDRTWCGIQAKHDVNCQSAKYSNPSDLTIENSPCHDCIAQKELFFYAGHFHGEKHNNEPKKCLYAKIDKIAVFTSRKNDESEDERFVFAIGQMNSFQTVKDTRGDYELYHCDKDTAIIFNTSRPKFWKYYSNSNNPDREAWNSGLYRYLENEVVSNILIDIIGSNRYPNKVKKRAELLMEQV